MKSAESYTISFRTYFSRASDGTRLRYFDTGPTLSAQKPCAGGSAPPPLPLVFANGLGGPHSAWLPYLDVFRDRHRVLAWDYRGLYGSLLARPDASVQVFTHAEDLSDILNSAGVNQVHFVGWSMGVQVGLEFFARSPERVASLTFLNGTYGRPFRGLPLPFAEWTLPSLLPSVQKWGSWGNALLPITRSPLSYTAARTLGIVARALDRAHFYRMIRDFEQVDLKAYVRQLHALGEHDAEGILPRVSVPTLVTAGAKDVLTPPHLARKIALTIPHAELFILPSGTHYAPAEFPQAIAERVLSFIERKRPCAPAGPASGAV
jgi:pimeloyl-ACP methyl ester carboxylesterase